MNQLLRTKNLAIIGMLVALDIIFTRFWMIQTPTIRISLGFIAIATLGMLYGPVVAGIAAGISDIVGWSIAPYAPFFPGFTLTAILMGVIFGFFLHKSRTTMKDYIIAALSVTVVCDVILNTLWLTFLQNVPYTALLMTRMIRIAVGFILYAALLPLLCERIKVLIKKIA